jgi:DMSO reductase family type II enzyme heme b subunit
VKDIQHQPGPESGLTDFSYPKIDLRKGRGEKLRDAVRLQFPLTVPRGPERPHFFLGSPGRPVALWHWQADLNEEGKQAVVKELAQGFQKSVQVQADSAQDVAGRGVWKDGRWKVVMTRALSPRDGKGDVTFEVGTLVPFAVHAWDGANGEKGLMMSLSSWNYVLLDAPMPLVAYLGSLLALALVGALEWWAVRRVARGSLAARTGREGRS